MNSYSNTYLFPKTMTWQEIIKKLQLRGYKCKNIIKIYDYAMCVRART